MGEISHKPLITLAVYAHNHERFIAAAIKGAFAQTYSPLEIILSDDCSQDRSFSIMREMAAGYHGPHRVVLNRNASNLGWAGHVNRVTELANGQFVLEASGDDICLPQRAALTVEAWEKSGRRATSIYGRWIGIDETGNRTGEEKEIPWPEADGLFSCQSVDPEVFVALRRPYVAGCAHAYSKRLYERFGPLPQAVFAEDTALVFRSLLIGDVYFINQPTVEYRRHDSNMFIPMGRRRLTAVNELRELRRQVGVALDRFQPLYDCFRSDVHRLRQERDIDVELARRLDAVITQAKRRLHLRKELLTSSLLRRWQVAFELSRDGWPVRSSLSYLPPWPIYATWFLVRTWLREMLRPASVAGNAEA